MALKERFALPPSLFLLLCAIALMSVYVAFYINSSDKTPISYVYFSPAWSGGLALTAAVFGIYMSVKKEEKECNGVFVLLIIIGILAMAACVGLIFYAIIIDTLGKVFNNYTTGREDFWLAMFILSVVTAIVLLVMSCMLCCCQDLEQVVDQTITVCYDNQTDDTPPLVFLINVPPSGNAQQQFPGLQAPHQPMGPVIPPYNPTHTTAPLPSQNTTMGPQQHVPYQHTYHQLTAPPVTPQEPPARTQRGPNSTANSQLGHVYCTRINEEEPETQTYQPLIHEVGQEDGGHIFGSHQATNANIHAQHTSDLPSSGRSPTAQAPATDNVNSRLYEHVEDPSYDYAFADSHRNELTRSQVSAANAQYVNDSVDRSRRK